MDNEYNYDDWAELLSSFFFDDAHDGEEVLLAVDELALAESSGLTEAEACESLARAVASVIGPGWQVGAVRRRVDEWRGAGADGPHPALPFLALTVLAAYRMGSYEGYASHNFYVPLRRTLNDSDPEVDTPGSYLDYIRKLWKELSEWADAHRRGRLTIRHPGTHFGRGLAMQHALVKSSDLRQLDAFFRRIGLHPGESVPAAQLRRALAAWTGRRVEPWAVRLNRLATDEELIEYAEALLAREAARWDGRPRDPRTGRAVGRIRLGVASVKRAKVGLYLQWDDRLPERTAVTLSDGSALDLDREHGWYSPHPIPDVDVARAMSDGLRLRGDAVRFDLRGEQAYALTYDDDLGSWLSVDTMSFGDLYHLIVRAEVLAEVLEFAKAASSAPPATNDGASKLLPLGWRLLLNVRLDARPTVSIPPSMGSLVPAGGGPRLRLLSGLPVRSTPGVYLRGGEPALALSTIADDQFLKIRQWSTDHLHQFRADPTAAGEFPLWQLRLDPDIYAVTHGDSEVTLEIVDGIAEAAGPGAGTVRHLGHNFEVVGTSSTAPTMGNLPITVDAPLADERVVLLGSCPGQLAVVKRPAWLSDLAGWDIHWRTIDAWVDFTPVWHLRGQGGRYTVTLLTAIEPEAAGTDAAGLWARMIQGAQLAPEAIDEVESLWARYRAAAGATTDG